MNSLTSHTTTRRLARLAAPLFAALALALTGLAGGAAPANANVALGCSFNASGPYLSGGNIYTRVAVKCTQSRYLYWHARLTKDRNGPDLTAGSSDGFDYFPAGQTLVWYLANNRDGCPGSGNYFGKLTIQATSLGTAYEDRSLTSSIAHC